MNMTNFKELSGQLHSKLSRVNNWRRIVRILSTGVYLFVFCWLMFVLLSGVLLNYIGGENYTRVAEYILPVFIGFVVVNFIFSRCIMAFHTQEIDAMRSIMSSLFPNLFFSFSYFTDNKVLTDSKLFTASFSDPSLEATTYGYIEVPRGEHSLYIVDIGVSHGLMNKWKNNWILGYPIMIYRYTLRPLFTSRLESSVHNFRGMFGWCKTEKRFEGNIILLPDHLEQTLGYLAKNIQGLKKRYGARLVQLEDPEFENYFAVYADDGVEARMLLTPAMMRHITELRKTFGHDMMLSFSKGYFYYAATMPDGFLRLRPKALNDGKLLEEIYNDISLACKVTDELRLNEEVSQVAQNSSRQDVRYKLRYERNLN